MKRILALIAVLTLLSTGTAALAMPIQLTGGSLTVKGTALYDGVEATIDLQPFNLFARNADGSYLIYADHGVYCVEAAELKHVTAALGSEGVSAVDSVETLVKGAKGDAVIQLQEALKTLGYLTDAADGSFGGGTERAIRDFQAAVGLEQTGEADGITQLLALSMTMETLEMEAAVDPEKMYAPIVDRVTIVLQPIKDSGMILEYDDMTGVGFISDGHEISYDASGDADIDRYELSIRFGLLVREGEDNIIDILPAVQVECLCVRRPVMNELTLKSGAHRGTAAFDSLESMLDGVNSLEQGVVLLNDEMIAALAGASEADELKLRIGGQYRTFDIQVEKAILPGLTQIGIIAEKIKG